MQSRVAKGEMLEAVARETSSLADTEGITGFMYGAAVTMLSQCWVHGEALRRWHNVDLDPVQGVKANEKGGVLNPAVLVIGRDDDGQ
jgi:hypothetical protein